MHFPRVAGAVRLVTMLTGRAPFAVVVAPDVYDGLEAEYVAGSRYARAGCVLGLTVAAAAIERDGRLAPGQFYPVVRSLRASRRVGR